MKKHGFLTTVTGCFLGMACHGMAGEPPADLSVADLFAQGSFAIDNLFLLLSAILVLFMQPGFAMVEAGFNASKNAVNILFKNVMDLCVGVLLFFLVGYGIMYGDSTAD